MAQALVRGGKAHGSHKVQGGPGDGAGAGDIAGVLGYFRLHQHDVKAFFIGHSLPPWGENKVKGEGKNEHEGNSGNAEAAPFYHIAEEDR